MPSNPFPALRATLCRKRERATGALAVLAATAGFSAPAFAHPGHEADGGGFDAGLLHSLLGLHHPLMLVLGLWAATLALRGAGLATGQALTQRRPALLRWAGALTAGAGLVWALI